MSPLVLAASGSIRDASRVGNEEGSDTVGLIGYPWNYRVVS
jgi:hypothetical protein